MTGAREHTELIAWQLCDRLRRLVLGNTRAGAVAKDSDYRRQSRRSARSACYLTSEGFYRYWHGEFGNYLNWARGSLGEALDQIDEGFQEGYFAPDVHSEMRRICIRALKANVALRKSWSGNPPPPDGLHASDAERAHAHTRRDRLRTRPSPGHHSIPKRLTTQTHPSTSQHPASTPQRPASTSSVARPLPP